MKIPQRIDLSVSFKVFIFCLALLSLAACGGPAESPKSKSAEKEKPAAKPEQKVDVKTTKNYAEAVKLYEEGSEFSKKGELDKAMTAYQESIKLNPLLPEVHYYLGSVYSATNKLDDAVKEYQEAIKLNPKTPEFHSSLGMVYTMQKKEDLAKQKYEDLKKLSPTHADTLMDWMEQVNKRASAARG